MSGAVFPFAALVGQEAMKLGLVLNVVDPGIGGVLIRGGKGTAKSTAVRALAALLPPVTVTEGCPFACAPDEEAECPARRQHLGMRAIERRAQLVTLPVGASEERLVGSIQVDAALQRGERIIEPGLLAAAHQGILYVDEVNLLADHLVDALLDAAAMGRNYIERDGISASHPSRFVLVGTMNPEEGELRPQLLDRFGLMVEAADRLSPSERAEVVRRRMAFESDPEGFCRAWEPETQRLAGRLREARDHAGAVEVPDAVLEAIVAVCAACEADGMRADLALYRAARANAAWEGRARVTLDDVRATAPLVLAHRQRRLPFEHPHLDRERIEQALAPFENRNDGEDGDSADPAVRGPAGDEPPGSGAAPHQAAGDESAGNGAGDRQPPAPIGRESHLGARSMLRGGRMNVPQAGRRRGRGDGARGRHIGNRAADRPPRDLDIGATLREAILRRGTGALPIREQDLRAKRRRPDASALVLMVVDASGSMGARRRMEAAKGAVLGLLRESYLRRDRVAFVAFNGEGARVVLPPTRSVDHAHRALEVFATGGRTPLAAGLEAAASVTAMVRRREPGLPVLLVLVSDGRANAGGGGMDPVARGLARAAGLREMGVEALVIDSETGPVRLGIARRLADALGGRYVGLDDLEPGTLAREVRTSRATVVAR